MTEEEKNKQRRKDASLTIDEWLGFFFVPVNLKSKSLFPTDDFNDVEEERFKKFGFDKKLKQSIYARILGAIFYFLIVFFIFKFI